MTIVEGAEIIQERIIINFEGDPGIEIDALIASLEYTKTTLRAAKGNIPNVEDYRIRVEPFKEGSFIVNITLITYLVLELLPSVMTMGKVLLETLKIWLALRGSPPKQIIRNQNTNTVEITGDNNTVINVNLESFNTSIDSKKIADDMSLFAKAMMKSATTRGKVNFSVEQEDSSDSVELKLDELRDIRTPVYMKDAIVIQSVNVTTIIINPIALDWENVEKWKYTSPFSEKPFNATIEDKDFVKKVQSGEVFFNPETKLKVLIKTTETLIDDGSGKKEYEHTILEVLEIINKEHYTQMHLYKNAK